MAGRLGSTTGENVAKKYPHIAFIHMGYGDYKRRSHLSAMHELAYAGQVGAKFDLVDCPDDAIIGRARSKAVHIAFANSRADVAFFYDHDMWCERGDTVEVARMAHEKGMILGGFSPKREFGGGFAGQLDGEPGDREITIGKKDDTVLPARVVGTGFMAIPRHHYETMCYALDGDGEGFDGGELSVYEVTGCNGHGGTMRYYTVFKPIVEKRDGLRAYVGEDASFCRRAQYLGLGLGIATRAMITHTGDFEFTLEHSMGPRR